MTSSTPSARSSQAERAAQAGPAQPADQSSLQGRGANLLTGPEVSIIVPVYNEAEALPELLERLALVCDGIEPSVEMIFVDDGSADESLDLLQAAAQADARIHVVVLSRNFGQHSAVFAGFAHARGEYLITVDADLQNPPEEIPKVLASLLAGYAVVGTVRAHRQDSLFRRAASRLVNRITAQLTGVALKDYGCMLRGYHREIVDEMLAMKDLSTFIPALAVTLTKNVAEIEVEHAPRSKGESKYSMLRLVSLQFDLLTSFSLKPIRALIYLGLVVSCMGLGFGLFLFIRRLVVGPEAEGLFTLFAILFVFIGGQFLAFGLLGEYIGRIYQQVRERPRFLVREVIGKGREDAGEEQS